MLLGRIPIALGLEVCQGQDQLPASVTWPNHLIDEASRSRHPRIGEPLAKFGDALGALRRRIRRLIQLAFVKDIDRRVRAHDRNFRGRPCVVEIGADVLACHHAVGAAVRLARDDGHLRNGGLGERIKQLGAVADDATVLLHGAGEKPRHIFEGHQRDVERIAKPYESRAFGRGVDVERAGQMSWLIGHDANGAATEPPKADNDIAGVVLMNFQEASVIRNGMDQLEHVVRLIRRIGHQPLEGVVLTVDRIRARTAWRFAKVVAGHEAQELSNEDKAPTIVFDGEVCYAAGLVVPHRAPQLFLRHRLVRDRLDHVGPGDEHVARLPDHDREVSDRRRIHRATCARPHDRGDLRDDARGQRVAEKDVGVAAERYDAFLNARATRVVEPDDRRPQLHREVHDFHDLRGVRFRQRAAEDGEILRERVDRTSIDAAVACDHAISRHDLIRHAEIPAAVGDELVGLLERARIEEQFHPLACGQLPGCMLTTDALGASTFFGAAFEVRKEIAHSLKPRRARPGPFPNL